MKKDESNTDRRSELSLLLFGQRAFSENGKRSGNTINGVRAGSQAQAI